MRPKAGIELLKNPVAYDYNHTNYSDEIIGDNYIHMENLRKLWRRILNLNVWGDMVTMFVISAAFDIIIQSYFPPTASNYGNTASHTRKVVGRGVRYTREPEMEVMWSSSAVLENIEAYEPDHFLLLVLRSIELPQA